MDKEFNQKQIALLMDADLANRYDFIKDLRSTVTLEELDFLYFQINLSN